MSIGKKIRNRLAQGHDIWLFLDYDGTLADFAPTPEDIFPNPEIIRLLARLAGTPHFRVAVISGRRLRHVKALLPVPGIILAGTYGLELRLPDGSEEQLLDYEEIRPTLEAIKPDWENLIKGREGFFLEDKGWSLALHAKFASDQQAEQVLSSVRHMLVGRIDLDRFRILGGYKFLEIGPAVAHKGQAVARILSRFSQPDELLVYIGDDDKDEEAFEVIKAHGGVALVVTEHPRSTLADYRLDSPRAVRAWLDSLLQPGGPAVI